MCGRSGSRPVLDLFLCFEQRYFQIVRMLEALCGILAQTAPQDFLQFVRYVRPERTRAPGARPSESR